MQRSSTIVLLLSAVTLAFSVAHAEQRSSALQPIDALVPSRYDFGLPSWAPKPLEPAANPTTAAKADLGRHLFYDTRLSLDGSMSCASCHEQARAFTDGRAVATGVTGQTTPRNAMSLANVAYFPVLTWSNPLLHHLEQQALVPLIGQDPVELGLAGAEEKMVERLSAEPIYKRLFAEAFPEAGGEISLATVVRALSAFQRTIVSMRSPYDRYRYEGDVDAVSDAAIRGEDDGARLEVGAVQRGAARDVAQLLVWVLCQPFRVALRLLPQGERNARGDEQRQRSGQRVASARRRGEGAGRSLFEDEVSVGAADTEGGDACASRSLLARPWLSVLQERESRGLPLDVCGGDLCVDGLGEELVLEREDHFDNAGDAGSGLSVSEV